MNRCCDLHCHSYFSDGTSSPYELVQMAKDNNISALALTDHNTSKGLEEFMQAGKDLGVTTVAGCEFSTEWNKTEIHIVGLFFKEKYFKEIEDFVEMSQIAKVNSNKKLIENLNNVGYDITYEEVAALTNNNTFNRAHVGMVLSEKGYTKSVQEAFDLLLNESRGFYVPAKRITSAVAIRFIKSFGATAIMAHPLLNLSYDQLLVFLKEAKQEGLDAIETHYTEFDEEMTNTAISLANTFDLKQSGGSDYHGKAKPGIYLGKGRGNLFVPYSFYEDMRACADLSK